jgi:ABC-type lipoprotein release transport system permease subunit
LLGISLSALIVFWLAYTGVPIPGDATEMLAQFNIPDRIYPQFSTSAAWFSVLVMMISTQFAALFSSWQITRLRAVDALRAQT